MISVNFYLERESLYSIKYAFQLILKSWLTTQHTGEGLLLKVLLRFIALLDLWHCCAALSFSSILFKKAVQFLMTSDFWLVITADVKLNQSASRISNERYTRHAKPTATYKVDLLLVRAGAPKATGTWDIAGASDV
jgi:hypothetical protein